MKQIPIKPRERKEVAAAGRLITWLAETELPLSEEQIQKMLDAADRVLWLTGERRNWKVEKKHDGPTV